MMLQVLATALLPLALGVTAVDSAVRLENVPVLLFRENTVQLSDDVTSMQGFVAWNYKPSGGSFTDHDRFHSFLIKVSFLADGETFQTGEQARVRLKDVDTSKTVIDQS